MSCVLCDEPASAGTIVFDDGRVVVLLHDDWAVAGHALVIAKQHVQNVSDLEPADAAHFWEVYALAERAVLAASGAERAMMLKLGIQVPHLHVHIYPAAASASRATVLEAFDGRSNAGLNEAQLEAFTEAVRRVLRTVHP